jgi:hypothetical protein
LPSLHRPQKTLEFDLHESRRSLVLSAVWTTEDERYDKIPHSAWQPAVKGLTADRRDLDLDREVVIKILEERKAEFGFPIVPAGKEAEKLCAWIEKEAPSDYLDWSRDPRLVPGALNIWNVGYHRPSGVGVLQASVHGRWPSASFRVLRETLMVALPTRHSVFTVSHGCIRVSAFLCAFVRDRRRADYPEERHLLVAASDRMNAMIARMIAAQRRLPLPPPLDTIALPPLSPEQQALFRWALDEQGQKEYTELTDGAELGFYDAEWVKLRHVDHHLREPERLSYSDVVTPSEILSYVECLERPLPAG